MTRQHEVTALNVEAERAFDLLCRPGRHRGAGVTAQVYAPPKIGPFGETTQGKRPPATVLTSSGVLDAALPVGMGDQQECCECVQQWITTAPGCP